MSARYVTRCLNCKRSYYVDEEDKHVCFPIAPSAAEADGLEQIVERLVGEASTQALDHPEAYAIMAKPIREAIWSGIAAARQDGIWTSTSALAPREQNAAKD